MTPARIAIALSTLLVITTAVACSSGTSSSDKTPTAAAKGGANPTTAATQSSNSSPAGGGAQKQLTITAQDFSFSAPSIDVSKGDTLDITFKNSGSATHTLSFFSDDAYTKPIAGADTGNVSGGATKSLSVKADAGLYYRCNIHTTQMKGEIEFQ